MTWLPVFEESLVFLCFEQSSVTAHFSSFQQLEIGNELSCHAESVSVREVETSWASSLSLLAEQHRLSMTIGLSSSGYSSEWRK